MASVGLLVQRAREVSPGFELTRQNAAIAAIRRRLDGLPLALELVAARLRLLPPTALLARLDGSLPLLSGGPRDLPERSTGRCATPSPGATTSCPPKSRSSSGASPSSPVASSFRRRRRWAEVLYEKDLACVRARLDAEAFSTAWAEGRAMTLEEAVAEALAEDA